MDRMCDLYVNEPVVELLFQKVGFRAADETRAAKARKRWAWPSATSSSGCRRPAPGCAATPLQHGRLRTDPPLFYAQVSAPFTDRPALQAYWQRAQGGSSYQRVLAEFKPIWDAMTAR